MYGMPEKRTVIFWFKDCNGLRGHCSLFFNMRWNMLHIGCHLSVSQGFLHMGKEALSIGADTFQFFTRNPRGGSVRKLDVEDMQALNVFMKEHQFAPILAHAPYTLNGCSKTARTRQFAREAMAEDLRRLEYVDHCRYNFHPGSHVGQGPEKGIELIADMLNTAMFPGTENKSPAGNHGRKGVGNRPEFRRNRRYHR
jgi:endonuclease IV